MALSKLSANLKEKGVKLSVYFCKLLGKFQSSDITKVFGCEVIETINELFNLTMNRSDIVVYNIKLI